MYLLALFHHTDGYVKAATYPINMSIFDDSAHNSLHSVLMCEGVCPLCRETQRKSVKVSSDGCVTHSILCTGTAIKGFY